MKAVVSVTVRAGDSCLTEHFDSASNLLVEMHDHLGQKLCPPVAVTKLPKLGRPPRIDDAVVR